MNSAPVIVGLGELLWDNLPYGKRWGGAPANVACHASQLGADAYIVSAIGNDIEGENLLKAVSERGINTCVSTAASHPTGSVDISLDSNGTPSYEIVTDRAWDHIPFTKRMETLAAKADAVAFGTLAQRSVHSRETIHRFLENTRLDCLKVFDVNLRETFFSQDIIASSLQFTDVLKVSEEELLTVAEMFELPREPVPFARAVIERFIIGTVVLTRGSRGCMIVTATDTADFAGVETAVVDSVGAGDAFMAAMTRCLLGGIDIHQANILSCRIASMTCTHFGATPSLPEDIIEDFKQALVAANPEH